MDHDAPLTRPTMQDTLAMMRIPQISFRVPSVRQSRSARPSTPHPALLAHFHPFRFHPPRLHLAPLAPLVLLLALLGDLGSKAQACASCGSGGDDPMILYPNETHKTYLGLTSVSNIHNVGPRGEILSAGGPDQRLLTTVAYGYGFSPRAFATVTWPVTTNRREDQSQTVVGDPSLSARYTAHLPSITEPWIPQVQVVVGARPAFAPSLRNSREPKTLLDVGGTGFPEVRLGLDLWYGLGAFPFGLAHVVSYPFARFYEGAAIRPGLTQRSNVTVGYRWTPHIKTLVGATQELRAPITVDQSSLPLSDQRNNSYFVTQDLMTSRLTMVRLTYARLGILGNVRNGSQSTSITASYMQSF